MIDLFLRTECSVLGMMTISLFQQEVHSAARSCELCQVLPPHEQRGPSEDANGHRNGCALQVDIDGEL